MVADQQRRRAEHRELYERRERSDEDRDRWYASGREITARERAEEQFVIGLGDAAANGDRAAVVNVLEYLEADPRYFRSGYIKTKVARRLAQAPLDSRPQARARALVLGWVDGPRGIGCRGIAPLAHASADNALRRALRERLHNSDERVSRRALELLTHVRHPQLSTSDLARAHVIALELAGRGEWLGSRAVRIARWLWTPEWEAELRELVKHHDPRRAGAKRLLEYVDRRRESRKRRPGP